MSLQRGCIFLWLVAFVTPVTIAETANQEDAGMVHIDEFYIDRYEFPNIRGYMPRVNVTWMEAQSLCHKQSKRLCREEEWERACRGPEDHLYGYSNSYVPGVCNVPYIENGTWHRDGLEPSGNFSACVSSYGAYDMIGNVWEWTDAWYNQNREWRVVRGGSWFHSVNFARADARYGRYLDADFQLDLIGFRCCRSNGDR